MISHSLLCEIQVSKTNRANSFFMDHHPGRFITPLLAKTPGGRRRHQTSQLPSLVGIRAVLRTFAQIIFDVFQTSTDIVLPASVWGNANTSPSQTLIIVWCAGPNLDIPRVLRHRFFSRKSFRGKSPNGENWKSDASLQMVVVSLS